MNYKEAWNEIRNTLNNLRKDCPKESTLIVDIVLDKMKQLDDESK